MNLHLIFDFLHERNTAYSLSSVFIDERCLISKLRLPWDFPWLFFNTHVQVIKMNPSLTPQCGRQKKKTSQKLYFFH